MSINLETNLRGPGPEHRLPRSSVVWEGEFPSDDAPAWVCLSKPGAPMVIRCYQATSRTCDVISTHGRWLLESCLVPRRPVLPDEIAEGWDLAVGDVEPGWSIVYAGHELWFPQRVLRVDVVSDDWQRVWTIGDDSTRHVWRSTRACDLDNGFVTGLSCDDRPVLRWLPRVRAVRHPQPRRPRPKNASRDPCGALATTRGTRLSMRVRALMVGRRSGPSRRSRPVPRRCCGGR